MGKRLVSVCAETRMGICHFIVRRAYLMAQIMEDVTGESMEKSAAFFLTDAAFFRTIKDWHNFM